MMASVHPWWRSTQVAVFVQFLLGLAIPLWLGGFQFGPLTAFGLVATVIVAVVVAIYIA